MHKHSYLAQFLLILTLLSASTAPAQRSEALLEHYRLEQQAWLEYMQTMTVVDTNSNFDVTFYHLQVEASVQSPYIWGNVLCRYRATRDSVASIKLNLRREYTIDSIRGDAASFTFTGDTIRITLASQLSTGDTGGVRVFYRGVPPVANSTKGLRYTTHASSQRVIASLSTPFLAHYWWPCKDGPGDKPDSVYVDITIPDTVIAGYPMVAVSNGVLEDTVVSNGKKTFKWRERYPIVPYYVMMAASNYRDFHQMFIGSQGERFPMDYYVFAEHLAAAQTGVADLPLVMQLYSDLFGIYPFRSEKYGMTQLGYYGAIENQTNTIINNMGTSYFGVAAHELAHMWFGDMITCRDWHHGWLNEGFATYCEALWAEETGGFTAYKNAIANDQWFNSGTVYLQNISDPFGIFIGIIYSKGAYVLHMLRGVLGDSVFFNCLTAYASDPVFRYDHATTEDFRDVCETVSGRDLDFFFDQWVYDQYYPAYRYGYSQNVSTGETSLRIEQTQAGQGRRAVFEMPVQVKFNYQGGGDTLVTVWNDQQNQTFLLNIPQQILSMDFDPDVWILRTAQMVGVDEEPPGGIVAEFRLDQNYPNPFNPSTTLRYAIPERSHVTLRVYNILGQQIASLFDGVKDAGEFSALWDGRNDAGSPVGSGVYICRLDAHAIDGSAFTGLKTMILLK